MHRVRIAPSFQCVRPALLAMLLAASANAAQAAPPSVDVTADQTLRFGSFFTDTAGSRTVFRQWHCYRQRRIVPVTGASPGPAQFTINYDRGNKRQHQLFAADFGAGAEHGEPDQRRRERGRSRASIPTCPGLACCCRVKTVQDHTDRLPSGGYAHATFRVGGHVCKSRAPQAARSWRSRCRLS